MFLKRGDLVYVDLDPRTGTEIGKTRPAVIISNNVANEFSSLVTVLPITSKRTDKIYPFEVLLTLKDAPIGKRSKIKVDQIRSIDKLRIVSKVGSLKKGKMADIERALVLHLGIRW